MKSGLGLKFFLGLLTSFTLFFGVGTGYTLMIASAMPNMDQKMAPAQCQLACTPQSQSIVQGPKTEVDNKDIEPQPAEPYYLAFAGIGWTTSIAVATAYLLRYLRWRPPDLFQLNVSYRF